MLALDYNVGHGRYLMPAVVLSAATWGVIVDVRPLAWFGAAAGAATLLLAFVHYGEKPAGIALLGGESRPSVWSASRATILGAWHVRGPFRVVDELAESGDTIALRLRQDDVSYPYFGAALDRRVVFVSEREDCDLGRGGLARRCSGPASSVVRRRLERRPVWRGRLACTSPTDGFPIEQVTLRRWVSGKGTATGHWSLFGPLRTAKS